MKGFGGGFCRVADSVTIGDPGKAPVGAMWCGPRPGCYWTVAVLSRVIVLFPTFMLALFCDF
jgi:hypothetical protein